MSLIHYLRTEFIQRLRLEGSIDVRFVNIEELEKSFSVENGLSYYRN